MAKPFRPKRGTTAQNDAFTGLEHEITLDKNKKSLRIHDGVTAGGAAEILPKDQNDELYAPKGLDVGVTSVNGNTGDITPEQTGCLPLSGGTMTGAIFCEGLLARSSTTSTSLHILGGTNTENGSGLFLYGNDGGEGGMTRLRASNADGYMDLLLYADGRLIWGGKAVERVQASGSNYTRHTSGLQVCWGYTTIPAGSASATITLPAAFADTSFSVNPTTYGDSGAFLMTAKVNSTTSITIASQSKDNGTTYSRSVYWQCVGKWY